MARRSEHTQDEIRQLVINAAETIIVKDGLAKLNVRTIALEIGYTVGSIYMVFANMTDLILHLKARTLDDIALHLQRIAVADPPQQCLITLSKTYLNFAHQHFNRWQMLFGYNPKAEAMMPDWYKSKVAQLFKPVECQLARLAPNASPEQTQRAAQALWSGVHGICVLSLQKGSNTIEVSNIDATVALLVKHFVHGWIAHP